MEQPLTVQQYKQIKQVKDASPFTCNMDINTYINGVRFRLAQWDGINEEKITDQFIYNFLIKLD